MGWYINVICVSMNSIFFLDIIYVRKSRKYAITGFSPPFDVYPCEYNIFFNTNCEYIIQRCSAIIKVNEMTSQQCHRYFFFFVS